MLLSNGERRIERLEYNGRPLVTLEQVDELHGYYLGTSSKTFYRYREKFAQGKDYLVLPFAAWSKIKGNTIRSLLESGYASDKTFLTRYGYLLLIKRFNDDLAWRVQQMLINGDNVLDELLAGADQLQDNHQNMQRKILGEISLIKGRLQAIADSLAGNDGKSVS